LQRSRQLYLFFQPAASPEGAAAATGVAGMEAAGTGAAGILVAEGTLAAEDALEGAGSDRIVG